MKIYDEEVVYELTPKGIEMGKIQIIIHINDLVNGICPFCKIETYSDDEYTYIPFDVDLKKQIIYCKNCSKTIITMDEMLEDMLIKIKEENE